MIRIILAISAFILPTIAWAQDAVADGGDTFATIYLVAGGLVFAGLGALATWGIGKLQGTRAKEIAGRFIGIFNTGLQGAHAKFKLDIEAARDANSPGGAVITDKEWQAIRDHMWDYLKKTHGNFASIQKVVGAFTGIKTEEAVRAFVDSKIDAGIAELERADKGKPGPA